MLKQWNVPNLPADPLEISPVLIDVDVDIDEFLYISDPSQNVLI